MLSLKKMTEEDFQKFQATSKESYKNDKIKANGFTEEEAGEIAEKDFQRILPDGFHTKDNFLFMVTNEAGNSIGHLWYVIRCADNNRKAFIADILIYEKFQGQGLGRKTMQLLEEHVKDQGLKHIGLHVFGFNKRAIGLYESLDYQVTDLVMEKELK